MGREKNKSKEFWIMTIPGIPSRHQAYKDLFNSVYLSYMDSFMKMRIPSFKLIAFEKLTTTLEQLINLDQFCFQLLLKTEEKLLEVVPRGNAQDAAYSIHDTSQRDFIKGFIWDTRRYPETMNITQVLSKLVESTIDFHSQFIYFSCDRRDAVTALEAFIRKNAGTVTTRDLNVLIPEEKYIVESKHFTTLFIIVPKHLSNLWSQSYEHITQHIVPGSSQLITADSDFDLYNLVIWRKGAEYFREFITTKTELTFRPFIYDPTEFRLSKGIDKKLHDNATNTTTKLSNWLRINFRKVFIQTLHVKTFRLYVESLVKYGLPFRFQMVLVEPKVKKAKKLLKEFDNLLKHLEVNVPKEAKQLISYDATYKPYPFTNILTHS